MPNIKNKSGIKVPIITFYSASGGVGKSTLTWRFAQLITKATGIGNYKPNVLIIDLDVQSKGITYRYLKARPNVPTVHEIFALGKATHVQAIDITSQMEGEDRNRGSLYLLPAAPDSAKGIFDTMRNLNPGDLYNILNDVIESIVEQYDISCVIIDCYPGGEPYSAAAATLADIPLFIGRNDPPSYEGIDRIPEMFRESYPEFDEHKQTVIINSVLAKDQFDERAKRYKIFDWIPFTPDIILETEGLSRVGSYQMLLIDKYLVDIMKKKMIGWNHLIPEDPLPEEYGEVIEKLKHVDRAPKMRRMRLVGHLSWLGIIPAVVGVGLVAAHGVLDGDDGSTTTMSIGIVFLAIGIISTAGGWYFKYVYKRISRKARELIDGGPQLIMEKLSEGRSSRKELDEIMKLADTIK